MEPPNTYTPSSRKFHSHAPLSLAPHFRQQLVRKALMCTLRLTQIVKHKENPNIDRDANNPMPVSFTLNFVGKLHYFNYFK